MDYLNPLKELFEPLNRIRTYPKGSIIIMQGGNPDEIYRITDGLGRIYDIDANGSQRTVALFSRNNIIPATWLLVNIPPTGALYFYQALTNVTCYSALRVEARQFLKTHPRACRILMDALNKAYLNSLARIQNLQHSRVNERVDFILYYIATVFGLPTSDEKIYKIPALITHQEIADLAGLSRETVSTFLVEHQYGEIITKEDSHTFIHLDKLELDIDSMPKVFSIVV